MARHALPSDRPRRRGVPGPLRRDLDAERLVLASPGRGNESLDEDFVPHVVVERHDVDRHLQRSRLREDRFKVARVIYNRLETDATNGLLQIDAAVNYAHDRDLGVGLTLEDLEIDSPYNTYKNPGLPPTPIEAPGDKAIEAAANPAKGPWVYYVTVNLRTGETKFTEDYDEFLRFKQEFKDYCANESDNC